MTKTMQFDSNIR